LGETGKLSGFLVPTEHYWLVDPEEKTMECFALKDGLYALIAAALEEDVLEHPDFPGLTIKLGPLWKN